MVVGRESNSASTLVIYVCLMGHHSNNQSAPKTRGRRTLKACFLQRHRGTGGMSCEMKLLLLIDWKLDLMRGLK